jgi:hypothetical protein
MLATLIRRAVRATRPQTRDDAPSNAKNPAPRKLARQKGAGSYLKGGPMVHRGPALPGTPIAVTPGARSHARALLPSEVETRERVRRTRPGPPNHDA